MAERAEDPMVEYALELEEADRALARAGAEVDELREATRGLRERASELEGRLARLPAEQAEAGAAVVAAERELVARRAELAEAEGALAEAEQAGDEERAAAAARALARSRDSAAWVEARLGRARSARDGLERAAVEAREELPRLEARARELAARIGAIPRVSSPASNAPDAGPAGTIAWAARAEAALFVARNGLATERERVVREANELGASVLGEPLSATSVTLVRRRLEQRG